MHHPKELDLLEVSATTSAQDTARFRQQPPSEGLEPGQQTEPPSCNFGLKDGLGTEQEQNSTKIGSQRQTNKTKQIKKPDNQRQLQKQQQIGKVAEIRFMRMKRKIATPKKKESANVPRITLNDILDWQMETATCLQLTRNAFYAAAVMSRSIFQRSTLNFLSAKIVNLHSTAIMSLSAKMESNRLNYAEVLAGMCSTQKEEIINSEFFIAKVHSNLLKKLGFCVPIVTIYEQVVEYMCEWGQFVGHHLEELKINPALVRFETTPEPRQWSASSVSRAEDVFYFFDAVLLKNSDIFDIRNRVDIRTAAGIALFTVLNHETKGFFPLSSSDRTYLLLIFYSFLSERYHSTQLENQQWTTLLVSLRYRLNIVENCHIYFQSRRTSDCLKEDSLQQENMADVVQEVRCGMSRELDLQSYHGALARWK